MTCHEMESTRQGVWLKQDDGNFPISCWYVLVGNFQEDVEEIPGKRVDCFYSLLIVLKVQVVPSQKPLSIIWPLLRSLKELCSQGTKHMDKANLENIHLAPAHREHGHDGSGVRRREL